MTSFKTRSSQKELIDDFNCDGGELRQTLKELKIINKRLGGNHVTTDGIRQLLASRPHTQEISIADVGCGGGDMMRVMYNWAKKKKLSARFIGVDANPHTVAVAAENLRDLPNMLFEVADVFDPAFEQQSVDIVTCTLFTHHFKNEELVQMLSSFKNKACIGIILNDLHRHPLAFYSRKILARLFSRSRFVINDAPISVQRSFKRGELVKILKQAGWQKFKIRWHWAFRWQVVAWV